MRPLQGGTNGIHAEKKEGLFAAQQGYLGEWK